ncbi:DUF6882 domain-containing protein [Rothia sp. ZJ932]|uniref:DUF6882 domain-containing protein n=1 Tax=Rothia sp. ZJ932 TaxID=2810516 RepID=UPI001966D1DC|nr:DUF6882 domain-containing protein [Rothia sp. ZJ932]QRZ62014.1 hydrolase [Rothia sp. ZJ932]
MMKTLQDLIDESIFISTEYQARLAELTGDSDWSVDFSAPSFTLEADNSVTLNPYLLGTESESRGTWIWSWKELGYFPDAVVAPAIQTREGGAQHSIDELTTDELTLKDGLARRLALAAKTLTGVYAHYPVQVGPGVRAWILLDGDLLELEAPTVNRMGRVMAQALQTGTAVNHLKAVDSYARLRGAHIAWDTEATAVITASDGALRLWFDEGKISGIEAAEPTVDASELNRCAAHAASLREQLRSERSEVENIAAAEASAQTSARAEQEAREKAEREQDDAQATAEREAAQRQKEAEAREEAARAEREKAEREAELAAAREAENVEGTTTTDRVYTEVEEPYNQAPSEDIQPGRVTTNSLPAEQVEEPAANDRSDEQIDDTEVLETETVESNDYEVVDSEEKRRGYKPAAFRVAGDAPDLAAERKEREDVEPEAEQKKEKKGFFSRFFGL